MVYTLAKNKGGMSEFSEGVLELLNKKSIAAVVFLVRGQRADCVLRSRLTFFFRFLLMLLTRKNRLKLSSGSIYAVSKSGRHPIPPIKMVTQKQIYQTSNASLGLPNHPTKTSQIPHACSNSKALFMPPVPWAPKVGGGVQYIYFSPFNFTHEQRSKPFMTFH